ncbi:MAG: hypothetical protein ACPGWR_17690 [Ardenticatenaceae bacterium]
MKVRGRFYLFVVVALLMSVTPVLARPSTQAADYDIPNGHFFTQTGGGEGGFSVLDDSEARFWSEFQRLGGLQTVGYPISQRYERDGFVTQAFQKLILQWRSEEGQAWPVNLFDELSNSGFDQTLKEKRQTPLPLTDFDPPDRSWEEIVAKRQGLLDENEAIRARYFSYSDPLTLFGLPTSRVEDMGNHFALRTQRAVFQQWKEEVPWAQEGEVTIANGGDIGKELAWLPEAALQPQTTPSANLSDGRTWQAPPVLVQWTQGPGFTSYEFAWSTVPRFVLYNDGRVVTSDWQNGKRVMGEAQLSEEEVCAFLTEFDDDGFFDFDPETYEFPPIADASTSHIRVNAWRTQKLDLYALRILVGSPDQFPVSPSLIHTYNRLDRYQAPNVYQPEQIAVLLTPAYQTEEAIPAWPLTTPSLAFLAGKDLDENPDQIQALLTGQVAEDVYNMFDGKITGLYSEGNLSYQVTIRPLFPLESSKPSGGWREPDIFPATPTKEMSCP